MKSSGFGRSLEAGEDIDHSVPGFEAKRSCDIQQFIVCNRTTVLAADWPGAHSDGDVISGREEEDLTGGPGGHRHGR